MQEIVQSVDRSLSIIEVLSDYENGLGITEISEKVNLHKSTVYRLLATLIYKGYVKQNQNNSKYSLTLKLFELGNKKVENMSLTTVALPYLRNLMEKTNEVVHLVVRDGIEMVYVFKAEPQKTIRMYSSIGKRIPMYCTSVGKAMMSQMTEKEVDMIWQQSNIKKLTDKTITDIGDMKKNLKEIRRKGYAIDEQENEIGIRCIGTVIKDYKGELCGAISISGSILTFTTNKVNDFSNWILECANTISKELGYRD
ncbi:transcriptional regulator KdgR [Clostridium ragsdalei P11]|uniref:Glycerol operon regulatory protein n=1 Tax=Clostridium ragsdalei P11 TaxID=1353534 RepID=A0A1A6AQK0_9CLOT|nr:IclR family transcriptional regulator [Clostridium ragsdalei]OBR92344.1 transcriptional regulator KdgR [Clostridium ragsdalei P11]